MGKTKQNGILHRLRRGIMCGALSCVLVFGAVLIMPGMEMTARAADYFEDKGIRYLCDNNSLTAKVAYAVDKDRSEVYIPATIEYKGQKYYAYPTSEQLSKASVDEIIACSTGYRDKYNKKTRISLCFSH